MYFGIANVGHGMTFYYANCLSLMFVPSETIYDFKKKFDDEISPALKHTGAGILSMANR